MRSFSFGGMGIAFLGEWDAPGLGEETRVLLHVSVSIDEIFIKSQAALRAKRISYFMARQSLEATLSWHAGCEAMRRQSLYGRFLGCSISIGLDAETRLVRHPSHQRSIRCEVDAFSVVVRNFVSFAATFVICSGISASISFGETPR